MNLGLFNELINTAKESNLVQNLIKQLSDYLKNVDRKVNNNMSDRIESTNLDSLKEEDTLYQVVDIGLDGVYLKNMKNNKLFEETNISKELQATLGNDYILRYKNREYIFERELTNDFFNSLVSIKEYEEIQNQFIKESNILEIDSNARYNVITHEKDYSILSYEGNKNNTIKVPNVLLPYFIDNETVLKYKNGKFENADF